MGQLGRIMQPFLDEPDEISLQFKKLGFFISDHYARIESRARHRAHRKNRLLPPLPAHVDEVTIEQQPRGSYVLEVFHGYLCVGGQWSLLYLTKKRDRP